MRTTRSGLKNDRFLATVRARLYRLLKNYFLLSFRAERGICFCLALLKTKQIPQPGKKRRASEDIIGEFFSSLFSRAEKQGKQIFFLAASAAEGNWEKLGYVERILYRG